MLQMLDPMTFQRRLNPHHQLRAARAESHHRETDDQRGDAQAQSQRGAAPHQGLGTQVKHNQPSGDRRDTVKHNPPPWSSC